MAYRSLGKAGLVVRVIGFGGEWMERADQETCTAVTRRCEKHHIGECSLCKCCEARCPFHVKVHERMQKAAKLFGC